MAGTQGRAGTETATEAAPGMLRDGAFVMPIRVYYADTDAGGIVYHAVYLEMAERCRAELLRAFGWPLVGADGTAFIARRAQIDWIAPARLDDLLLCETRVATLGGASLELRQDFTCAGLPICAITVALVHVSAALRPRRLPPELRAAFAALNTPV